MFIPREADRLSELDYFLAIQATNPGVQARENLALRSKLNKTLDLPVRPIFFRPPG
jgi:hypothetical protein